MQQIFSLLSWRLFTARHVSGVFPSIFRSSMTAVTASGFTFVSWWESCCVRGRAGRPQVPYHKAEFSSYIHWNSYIKITQTSIKYNIVSALTRIWLVALLFRMTILLLSHNTNRCGLRNFVYIECVLGNGQCPTQCPYPYNESPVATDI
jgi:hypothetical protein